MAVTDLSSLADGAFSMGGSMAAGNTMSDAPWGGATGSDSEQSFGVDVGNHPEIDLGDQVDYAQFVPAGDDAHDGFGWTTPDVDGDGWTGTRP